MQQQISQLSMMQQQISQQEQQYGSPQQMAQPMMLCPIQYVYETPMLMPRGPEEQVQQNQPVLFNIQNTPPWIQNRSQNQLVYVQQVPNNYQPYMQQNIMQSPMYHQQLSYQMHPMLAQDNRQFVQIPNLAPYNTVQSQLAQTVAQQQINNEDEKMPLLTQMLSQKNNVNVVTAPSINNATVNNAATPNVANAPTPNVINVTASNINNVTGPNNHNNVRTQNVTNVRPANINNIRPSAVNVIRPMMQNQQVQTDISANNRPRPRNAQPQLITINPMQHAQYLTNQQQDVMINISRPTLPYNIAEVPQHIRSKVPSSISVKTIYRPILPRQFRPFDVMPGPQNFYYTPNFVTVPNNPEMRNNMNTDNSQLENNNNVQGDPKPTEVNVQTLKKTPTPKNQEDIVRKRIAATVTAKAKFDLVKMYNENNAKTINEMNTERKAKVEPQAGEKLIRNTVYSQARGRVNENDILHLSPKRTISDRQEEERIANTAKSDLDPICNSNKFAKVEFTENFSETNDIPANSPAANVPVNSQQSDEQNQKSSVSNFTAYAENVSHEVSNTPESDKIITEPSSCEVQKQGVSTDLEQINSNKNDNESPDNNVGSIEPKVIINKMANFVHNNSVLKVETNSKGPKLKEDINVLTHVLDGYIIQESNVAFPIYIPKENEKNKRAKRDNKTDNADEVEQIQATRTSWRCSGGNVDREVKTTEDQNKDNPFANVPKSAVLSWTTAQLAEHLEKFDWKETACKLQEEEIDGESLLLVNKEQLVVIGVCETHAEVIAVYASGS